MTAAAPEPVAVAITATGSGATPTDLALARVEGKIDVVLTRHETKIDAHDEALTDHETRLRTVENEERVAPAVVEDHEARLRVVEAKPTVSPRALWTTVVSAIAAAGGLLALFDRLTA